MNLRPAWDTQVEVRLVLDSVIKRLILHLVTCNFCFYVLGDSGVWGLKKNFALLELLERLQNGHIGQYGAAEEAIGVSGEVLIELGKMFVTRCYKITFPQFKIFSIINTIVLYLL